MTKTIYWETDEPLSENSFVMTDFIDHINTSLDIYLIDGTYAEGVDNEGNYYEIHASGDGDFTHHKVELMYMYKEGEDL